MAFNEYSVYKPTALLHAESPVNGIGKWKVIEGMGYLNDSSSAQTSIFNLSKGKNVIRWEVNSDGCGSVFTDQVINYNNIKIPNAFSPNGDTYNETFVIEGIQEYPDAKFEVYNKFGKLIFKSSKYQNEWNGRADSGIVTEGTYFYILKLTEKESQTGYIQVKK